MRVGRLGLGPLVERRQRHCRRYVALAQPGIDCQLQCRATRQDRWREGQYRGLSDPEKSQAQHGNPYSIRDGIARHSLRVHEEFCCFAQLLESECALNDQCTLLAIASHAAWMKHSIGHCLRPWKAAVGGLCAARSLSALRQAARCHHSQSQAPSGKPCGASQKTRTNLAPSNVLDNDKQVQ